MLKPSFFKPGSCSYAKIYCIYIIIPGHAGGNNTWVTNRQVLSHLKQLQDLSVTVHVTPYQVKDELRVWIGREQRQFTRNLRSLGVPVEETLHFKEEEASLDNHFRVLTVF